MARLAPDRARAGKARRDLRDRRRCCEPAARRAGFRSGLALVALCIGFAAQPAAAQASPSEKELAEIEARLKARAEEEKRLRDEAEAREKEVAELRYRMIETTNSLQDAERRLQAIAAELNRLDAEEARISTALIAERENLADVLAALQSLELGRPPALLVSPDDANRAARAAMLLSEAAPVLEARAAALKESLDALTRVRAERERERQAYEKTNEEISARRTILAELLEKKQAERDVAASLAAAAQRETAALAARASSLREVLQRLERLASAITPRLKPSPPRLDAPPAPSRRPSRTPDIFAPARPFAEARGALRPPVVGRLVGEYGAQRPEGGRFEGIRFAVADQAIVTAPYEANVAFARPWGPVGNLIVLDVGGGYHILLIGVGAFLVQEGQRVAAGEPVAAMAAPPGGGATLDLEIRKNGEPVNPSLWLSRKSMEDMAF
ncbi:murein hydrolase activator EnvC family protein [Amphiplicatus metriothermophilus]|uniref:murein hydrolase activator EnvC family protein n=1 Tax=Amphiplicatus metriothermophilus TaxID=1519374 RepID=UPI001356AB30|nr:peptidoglycan DD-metalloendopeptidase family protein [Amphiplicatus metriothermophilus]MBB5517900.1 septal ring factor EnvC (AmiA/AmiB activator) [Amphiplicatus metriothermophilus]